MMPHLRSHVVRSAAEGVGGFVQINLELAHSEVNKSDVTLVIEKEIVQLQISETFR